MSKTKPFITTTKAALIAIILSTVCGATWVQLASNGDEHFFCKLPHPVVAATKVAVPANSKRPVVFAKNDIRRGTIIQAEALEQRPLDQYETPSKSYSNQSILAGRIARRDIKANHIVMIDDVNPDIGLENSDLQ